MYYLSSDFLTFLSKHHLKVIIGFEEVPKGAMHFAQIEDCYLDNTGKKPAKANGISPDDSLWELAKLVAEKEIRNISKHSAPSMVVIPRKFKLTRDDMITS